MPHKFAGLGREKWRTEVGSEGKRVANFSQPLRNGPAKLAFSYENAL